MMECSTTREGIIRKYKKVYLRVEISFVYSHSFRSHSWYITKYKVGHTVEDIIWLAGELILGMHSHRQRAFIFLLSF